MQPTSGIKLEKGGLISPTAKVRSSSPTQANNSGEVLKERDIQQNISFANATNQEYPIEGEEKTWTHLPNINEHWNFKY